MTIENAVQRLSRAIAHAEGFYVTDSLPQRCNNPGDLELGDKGFGVDNKKTIFETPELGWAQLEHECTLMLTGLSKFYKPSMTILQVAAIYTGQDRANDWAKAVAEVLHVWPATTLLEFICLPNLPTPPSTAKVP